MRHIFPVWLALILISTSAPTKARAEEKRTLDPGALEAKPASVNQAVRILTVGQLEGTKNDPALRKAAQRRAQTARKERFSSMLVPEGGRGFITFRRTKNNGVTEQRFGRQTTLLAGDMVGTDTQSLNKGKRQSHSTTYWGNGNQSQSHDFVAGKRMPRWLRQAGVTMDMKPGDRVYVYKSIKTDKVQVGDTRATIRTTAADASGYRRETWLPTKATVRFDVKPGELPSILKQAGLTPGEVAGRKVILSLTRKGDVVTGTASVLRKSFSYRNGTTRWRRQGRVKLPSQKIPSGQIPRFNGPANIRSNGEARVMAGVVGQMLRPMRRGR